MEHRWNDRNFTKQRTKVEQWNKKKNTTDTERRHIEQITWQNAKQENKEFYGKVEPSQKALSLE